MCLFEFPQRSKRHALRAQEPRGRERGELGQLPATRGSKSKAAGLSMGGSSFFDGSPRFAWFHGETKRETANLGGPAMNTQGTPFGGELKGKPTGKPTIWGGPKKAHTHIFIAELN